MDDSILPENRVVRFEQECVLIPETHKSKRTILVTLPLWKRRTASTGSDDPEPIDDSPAFKVTLPRFVLRGYASHI